MQTILIFNFLYVIALALLLFLVGRSIAVKGLHRSLCKALRDAKNAVVSNLQRKTVEEDPFEKEVQKEVKLKFQSISKTQLTVLGSICAGTCANVVFKIATGGLRRQSVVQDFFLLVIFYYAALCYAFEKQVIERFNDAWKLVLICIIALYLLDTSNEEMFYVLYGNLGMCRIMFSFACDNLAMVAGCNMIYSLIATFGMMRWQNPAPGIVSVVLIEAVMGTGVVLFASSYRSAVYSSTRQTLRIRTLTAGRSALEGMLTMMCEVVVVLDKDLRLDKHYPNLATMLLLNAQKDLAQTSIETFLAPSSEDSLEALRYSSVDDSLEDPEQNDNAVVKSGSLQATLMDSNRTKIDVDLFWLPFDELGKKRFLVGIREDTARQMKDMVQFPKQKKSTSSKRKPSPRSPAGTPGVIDRHPLPNLGDEASDSFNDRWDEDEQIQGHGFGSGSDSASDDEGQAKTLSSNPPRVNMLVPGRPPTSSAAKDVTLVRAMLKWNVKIRTSACCRFHAAAAEATATAARVRARGCYQQYEAYAGTSCRLCGVIVPSDMPQEVCDVCNEPAEASLARGSSSNFFSL